MREIILAGRGWNQMAEFSQALAESSGLRIIQAPVKTEILEAVRQPSALLVVIASGSNDNDVRGLIHDILMVNAMISCAVIGDMPEEIFHETMEGLGILMQLPPAPGRSDAVELWRRFRQANGYLFDGEALK